MQFLIHDGDHGGDDVFATLLAAASPQITLLGVTTQAGNAHPKQAAVNARRTLNFAGKQDVPVAIGADKPWQIPFRLGDGVFAADGIGGVTIPANDDGVVLDDAVAFMAQTLREASAPVTIAATGPLTNMALLLDGHPDVKPKIAQLQIMGGGTDPAGNIKPYAEFNFYMDPEAADFVLNAGVPTVLHTLNTTQQMIFGPERIATLADELDARLSSWLLPLMRLLEDLEKQSFGVDGTFNHDIQTILAVLYPELYQTARVRARVDVTEARGGELTLQESSASHLQVVTNMNSDAAFMRVLGLLKQLSA